MEVERGWGLSQQHLNFIIAMVAAFMWIAVIIHVIQKGIKAIKENQELNDQMERDLWGE
jgi:hypothetical protein